MISLGCSAKKLGGCRKALLAKRFVSLKSGRWVKARLINCSDIGSLGGGKHLFRSTADGYSSGRVVAFDESSWSLTSPGDTLSTQEITPAHPADWPIQHAGLAGNGIIVIVYLHDACAAVSFFDARTGKEIGETDSAGTHGSVQASGAVDIPVVNSEIPHDVPPPVLIPKHASIGEISSRPDSNEVYLSVETFLSKPYVLRASINPQRSGSSITFDLLDTGAEPPSDDLVCNQVFYSAEDGTRIPLFLCHRTDLDLSRPRPTLLHAYGGFGIPIKPHFDAFFNAFMQNLEGV